MNTPEIMVSIQCIAYNHEKYIRKALESFILQKTSFRFEVIVHDDASTDNTAAIIREYAQKYPDIIKPIIQTENQYRQGNLRNVLRNVVTPQCRGKYIALCEGDDYWTDPHKLQLQVDYMEQHPDCSYTFHNASIVYEDGAPYLPSFLPDTSIFKAVAWDDADRVYETADVIKLAFIPTASVLARAEYFVGRRDFCEKPICGDLPLRLSLSLDGYGYYFNRIMSAYRTGNPNSASGQAAKNKQAIRNTFYGHKAILDGFNEYTEYRWNEEIQFDINRRKFRTYFSTEDYAAIRQEGLNSFIRKNGTRAFLIKYFLRTKTPGLFKLLKRVKTLVKK